MADVISSRRLQKYATDRRTDRRANKQKDID